ncbi:ABC transporter substrate-binding protein [Actinopolymorpha alba]|uniref:ABC transporter substrate-binding protein n=1 Tax=Actinopolymorpha alba TaxID=533267 RepID=UPI000375BB56|nr:ABC transporter substrate-binding protein [Actinopolymorpha alba]
MRNAPQRWRRTAAGFAALMCVVAVGLPTVAYAEKAEEEQPTQLVVAASQSVDTFNPFMSFFAIGYTVAGLTYDSLIDWSAKDYKPVPGIAASWKESSDHLTWTYTLRTGVKFSDGKPLTAHDAAFTYNLMMTDKDARASSSDLVENFESVEAPNDTTLVIKLKQPTNQMLALDNAIVPKHIWEKIDSLGKFKNFDFPLVGSGPFQVVEFKTDQFIRLKANKEYWGGAPAYDELVFRYYKTPDASVQALLEGEVDIVSGLTPAQFKALKGKPGITLNQAQNRRFGSITFNVGARTKAGKGFGDGHPALKDARVRQAIHHAIDKEEMIAKVNDGLAQPGVSYIPPIFSTYFWQPGESEKVTFDLAEANRILDEAGYQRGPDGIRRMPGNGQPLKFRLLNHSDTPTEATDSEYLKGWWKEVGIDTKIESADFTKLNDLLYLGKYDIIFSGWGVGPDPTSILSLHTCGVLPDDATGTQRDTDTFYCNPEYDKLHDQQKRESDIAARAEIVKQMQEILYTQAPVITLRYADTLEAYRSDRWTGFVKQPEKRGMISGQQGNWAYQSAKPVQAAEEAGSRTPLFLGGGAAVVVIAAAAAVIVLRRRRTADERE